MTLQRGTVVLDSSAWIELLTGGKLEGVCRTELNAAKIVVVPTLVIFEVHRKVQQKMAGNEALSVVALLSSHHVVDFTRDIALLASTLSLEHRLATADSIVLAHAHAANARLLTLNNDFTDLPGARVLRR